jgi:hypothetical protein
VVVPGDCVAAMRMLLPIVEYKERSDWLNRCSTLKQSFPFSFTPPSDGRIKTQTVS